FVVDALSDRIIILADGKLKAEGTTMKLKEMFGSGYKFIITKRPNVRRTSDEIKQILKRYLSQITIESETPAELVFRSNEQPNSQFIDALKQLDQMKLDNQILDYGLQNSTMDDVFFKITQENTDSTLNDKVTTVDVETINDQCRQ
ncbi:unnamed protein product, partial [Didymodactylos carnosus]